MIVGAGDIRHVRFVIRGDSWLDITKRAGRRYLDLLQRSGCAVAQSREDDAVAAVSHAGEAHAGADAERCPSHRERSDHVRAPAGRWDDQVDSAGADVPAAASAGVLLDESERSAPGDALAPKGSRLSV